MATEVERKVWDLATHTVTGPERLVLVNLAWHSHRDGRNAYPAVRTIARETSLSRRAVQKILRRLKLKGFLIAEGLMSRGAVRYALNLEALDRERYSQRGAEVWEPGSQTGDVCLNDRAADCESHAGGGEPGASLRANLVRGGGEPGSPDPSLNRPSEPSGKKYTGANAPAPLRSDKDREQIYGVLKRLAFEVLDTLGLEGGFADLADALKERAAKNHIAYDADLIGSALTFALNARRSRSRATA